jgi:starch-binding outer membrane protein SusE/F
MIMSIINNFKRNIALVIVLMAGLISVSCDSDELEDPALQNVDDELTLMVSDNNPELEERFYGNELGFTWSTGTNRGTGAAISYTLELDLAGNDFSNPIATLVENEKNTFSTLIDFGTLNNRLLESGLDPGETYELQARLTAKVANPSVETQTASTTFSVTTYRPVASRLFIVGDAAPNGWDITNATELRASTSQRRVFVYEGALSPGNFKFAVSRDDSWTQDFYNRHPDDASAIVYNEGGSGEDLQWEIEEEGDYRITVDLINETINISQMEGPPFSALYIVGDATESGWDVDNPVAFEQNEEDPFIFIYEGNLKPGEMKIFAGPMGDWCGEWYRPVSAGQPITNPQAEQNSGCDVDNNWSVDEETEGRYRVRVNTRSHTVTIQKVNLYIVGDASPSGWNIATPEAFVYEDGEFVFTGELTAGNFKISKFTGDWCDGEWINAANATQSLSETDFIYTWGCEGPDNQWVLTGDDAGRYEIRINLDTETMTITAI